MDIKTSKGDVNVAEVIEYRVSTLVATGRPIGWHRHGSENDDQPAVYQKFGINFNEGQKARNSEEWQEECQKVAQAIADANENISVEDVLTHLKPTEFRPGSKSGIKKSDYQDIGERVVEHLEFGSQTKEDEEQEHITNSEWANEEVNKLLAASEYSPEARPIKPKNNQTVAEKERERAIEEMRANGVSDEIINKVFPPKE